MAEGISGCMPIALRSVGDAIRLDSENKTKEAYCQYLSCIIYISQVLKDDAWDKDLRSVYNRDTAKLFQLLHQCQERALTIISSQASDPPTYQSSQTQTPKHLLPAPDGVQRRYSDSSLPDQQLLTPQSGGTRKLSNPTPPGVTLSTPPAERDLHLPSPPGSPRMIRRSNSPAGSPRLIPQRNGSRDPLERAYKENQQLILAYRTRIQNQGGRNQNVTSKSLSLLRRMSENLVIAQAREQALKKKLLERQQRLEEETNRRFGPAVLSTREDQEQRLVYTKILEFEQETVWPKHLRERLKLMPEDSKLIKEIITKIFCSSDHPLTQFLLQYQFLVYRKLAPLVKDVGIPYEKSARKAESEENKEMLEETCTNQRFSITNNGENEDSGAKDDGKSFSVSDINEASVENKSEFETGETLNDPEYVGEGVNVRDKSIKEVTNDLSENHGLESQENGSDVGKRNEVNKNCSGIDLKKLKAFLEDESLPRTVNNDEAQDTESGNLESTAREITDKSSEFESYYRELEEDMLGWESSDDDSDHVTVSKNDVDVPSETVNSKNDVDVPSEKANSKNDEGRPSETVNFSINDIDIPSEIANSQNDENRPASETVYSKNDPDRPSETVYSEDNENRPSETVNFSKNDIDIPSETANGKNDENRPSEIAGSKNDADRHRETANEEKPIAEQKEENARMEESGTDPTDLDDVMTSDKLESIVSDEEHSPQLLDVTVTDDKEEPNQMHPSREESSETPQDNYSSENTNKSDLEDSTAQTCIKPCEPRESIPDNSDSEQGRSTSGDLDAFESSNTHTINTSDSSDIEATQAPASSLCTDEGCKEEHVTVAAAEEVRSQLKNILVDIRFFLEKLQKLLMLAYEQLDTPAGRDLCYSCVEYPFFKPLWPMLLAVLRQLNYDKELCLADVMTANIQKNPEDLGVPHRLCMDDQKALDSTGNTYPYQMAVEELHKVVTLFCPLEKLECIVRTSRCICQCVEDYWEMKGKPRHSSETAIGCDDLLPILSFVVIRSGMAQLISECDAMEEFIPEGYLMGEEGYCLTTLLTALAYLATLKDQ